MGTGDIHGDPRRFSNHENFDMLNDYPVVDFHDGKAHEIRDNIFYLMRGYIFDLNGKKFFAFGGARSHDIQDGILDPETCPPKKFQAEFRRLTKANAFLRIKGMSWWEEEIPSREEKERGQLSLNLVGNKVDYVLSHCPPTKVCTALGYYAHDPTAAYLQNLIANGLEFSKWFSGHIHENKELFGKFIVLYEQIIRVV